MILNKKPEFKVETKKDLLYGINTIQTDAQTLRYSDNGKIVTTDIKLNMIPYYAWAHRGSGDMAVWLPIELNATKPAMAPTLASESKVDASHNVKPIVAINDGLIPKDAEDRTLPYYHWW
ncbi:hypothetical protein [Thalassobellus suaedae]|uniref:Non-reducing end beta-L-arabinofuranosidase-like GH127 C-terminal domain-containing protein n=1 Tax=Thalassobellus suaedae TaxID=3074124 RepID=A0ABY9XW72_9FLAO|nr:hypothetical protein RHP51_03960 [Flavobacteriaceae bacterium HL-DH14]